MAKFKPAKAKRRTSSIPQGGVSCIILIVSGMLLVMLFMYFVMRSSG